MLFSCKCLNITTTVQRELVEAAPDSSLQQLLPRTKGAGASDNLIAFFKQVRPSLGVRGPGLSECDAFNWHRPGWRGENGGEKRVSCGHHLCAFPLFLFLCVGSLCAAHRPHTQP